MAKNQLTWKQVVNNLLLRLASTGQLLFLAMILLLAYMVSRTPLENIAQVWTLMPELLSKRSGLGYTLFGITGGGWVAHARFQRRRFEREIGRVGEERNKAQQAHFKKKM